MVGNILIVNSNSYKNNIRIHKITVAYSSLPLGTRQTNFKALGPSMVVVPWLACLPSTLTFRVRFPPKPTVYSVKFVFDKNRNEQKGAGVGLTEKKFLQTLELSFFLSFSSRICKGLRMQVLVFCTMFWYNAFCKNMLLKRTKKEAVLAY